MNLIKSAFLAFILLLLTSSSWACSCVGTASVKEALKNADLVILGNVIDSQITTIWGDTSHALNLYERLKKGGLVDSNYTVWKANHPLMSTKIKDYKVIITEKIKGVHTKDTVTIRTGFGRGDCGFRFSVGQSYLIYAKNEYQIKYAQKKSGRSRHELKNIYRTSICTRTKELQLAQREINELNR